MPRPLVTRALLDGLDEGLLQRLLAPHGAFLERRRLAPDDDTAAWRARLAEALRTDDPDLPPGLQFALSAVSDLASPQGAAELRALAAERGIDALAPPERPADAALRAYLDERALFRDAHNRLSSRRMGLLITFVAPPDRPPRPLSPAGRALLRHGLGGAAGRDGGEGRREAASITDVAEELVAVFERPRAPGDPSRRDEPVVALFERAARTLAMNTTDPDEQERLRALFGRALYGDEAAFAPARCLSDAPLRELGEASLRPSGVDGLAAVRLRKLVVRAADVGSMTLSAEAGDLAGALGEGGTLRELVRLGRVVHCALEFVFAGRAPFLVELYPPNAWRLPDRRDAPPVRHFLALRGFLTA